MDNAKNIEGGKPYARLGEVLSELIGASTDELLRAGEATGVEIPVVIGWRKGFKKPDARQLAGLIGEYQPPMRQQEALWREITGVGEGALPDELLGIYLQSFRMRAKMSLKKLADDIESKPQTIGKWEMGQNAIDARLLPKIAQTLSLSREEYQFLLRGRLPALNAEWIHEQVPRERAGKLYDAYRTLSQKSVADLASDTGANASQLTRYAQGRALVGGSEHSKIVGIFQEASDSMPEKYKWFDIKAYEKARSEYPEGRVHYTYTPESKETGEVLHALRVHHGMGNKYLEKAIGARNNAVNAWEIGAEPVPIEFVISIKKALKLSTDEYLWLRNTRLPVLDRQWRKEHPIHNQAGQVVAALQALRGLSIEESAERIGIKKSLMDNISKGLKPITGEYIEALASDLDLDNEEHSQLVNTRFPAFNEEWLADQPAQKRAGLMLAAIRDYTDTKQATIEYDLGLSKGGLSQYETGKQAIPDNLREKLLDYYSKALSAKQRKLSGFTKPSLRKQIDESNQSIKNMHAAFTHASVHLGALNRINDRTRGVAPDNPDERSR